MTWMTEISIHILAAFRAAAGLEGEGSEKGRFAGEFTWLRSRMLGPEFWSQVHAPDQERGDRPCSIHQERRVFSPAADGAPWNDSLLLRPCSSLATSWHLACRIRCLKENYPHDKKLQALKKMILAQRRKCIPHLPEKNIPSFPLEVESRSTKPLKRKVCKAGAFSAPACPGHSKRTGKKLKTGQNSASSSRKAERERAVSLFGVSAWREGQKLARDVLGPPLKYQNLKTELKSKAKESLQESQGDPFTESWSDRSFRENGQAVQAEMTKMTKRERHAAQLNRQRQDWKNSGWAQTRSRRRQEAPDTEKKNENHPRSAGRTRKAGSTKGSSDGLKATPSPKIQNASAEMMGMRETSRPGKGRRNGSSLRSETPRNERQPTTTLMEAKKKPYSPEQLREYMVQKAAERNRRIQEERKTVKQAQEERNKKLQEVYRKQREAAGRSRHCAEQLREDLTSVTPTENDLDLKYPGVRSPATDAPKGVHRASQTLLRKELKFNSELEPRMDKAGQGTPVLGLCTSMDPEGQLGSPLKLKQVDISSSWASHHSPSPFHLWREKGIGRETPFSSDISTSPSYRRKQDRVKAIHNLAKDLSERLGREMERLQATKASRSQGCPPGTPSKMTTPSAVPLEKFDAPENAESVWGSRLALNPLMCPQERAGLEKELGIPVVKEEIVQHLLPTDGGGLEVMPMDSVERRQSGTEEKHLKEGFASEMGFGEKGPTGAPASVFPGSEIHILTEIPKASLRKNQLGKSNCQNEPPENPRGQGDPPLTAQHQPSGFPFLSINLPPGKASAAEDLSEPTDSNSQWSEIGRFYGGASSFGRLSLTLVEQSLREEELRARHQSTLLRLREKALREKAQAELAWLEHGECSPNGLQGTGGPSSTAEKQLSILTRLKQEQAEIRHLQNIGRAAHQERKLLLQQQKELLEVQKTTTQLWLQLAGQLPHQISESHNSQGVGVLEKEKLEVSSQSGPLLATCSGGTEWRRSSFGAEKKHLAESKDILPLENRVAEGFAKWKPGKGDPSTVLETTIQDLYDPSGQRSQDPALGGGRTADHLASRREKEHDNGLTKNSQEDHPGSPLDKGPEVFASAGFSSVLRDFCPYPEKSPSGLEFHKGYAVLVNLSGSSPSPSDLDDDGLQDTDISLPEEFVFQEPPPHNLGVSTHHEAPAVPRIVINTENTLSSSEKRPQGQLSGGDLESKDSKRALYSQQKIWEGGAGTERLEESASVISSNSGRPQETKNVRTPTLRSSATPLTVSEELSCAGNGGNETTSQSSFDLRMVFSSTNDPFQSPETEAKEDPPSSFNVTGEDVEDETLSHFGNKEATVTLAPDASLDIGSPQDSEDPLRGPKHSLCHRFPNSPDHLLVLEDKTGCANRSTDECVSHKPDETTLQLSKTSVDNRDLAEEHRKSSSAKIQNTNKAGMPTVHLSSPQEDLLKNKGDAVCLSNQLLCELEDDVVSPVDEMLTYGSSELPSSTEKDASSWSTDLPAPPENLSGKDDEGNSSPLEFPSPPDPVVSYEAEELSSPRDLPAEGVGSSPQA
ncbi:coiled-coil domain-containing protein 187 [Ahaetulla prasina]|uniref:coiled-coil domain-containing protein 187 n=1 Tax=Ahaetulla prasina TaxID=499056 RepID=UPI0026473CFA|nr:coiled-coil domain-containing protein 187 [Ahaetulla prasina]